LRLATLRATCILALAVLLLAVSASGALAAPEAVQDLTGVEEHKPYFIIHLDAISSQVFFEMYDAGLLPNISELFSEGKVIPYAISPFMPGTEMIYPRLKQGAPASSDDPISWTSINRHTGEYKTYLDNVIGLWSWAPRYAFGQLLTGVLGLDALSRLSLANIERLLRDYGVVEFLWLASDTVGHIKGIDAQKSSAMRLDSMLAPLVRYTKDSPGSLNLVLYCDHGMSMIDEYVLTERAMAEVAGDKALLCFYPNVYLKDERHAPEVARALGERHEVDFAFWRDGEGRIVGCHDKGTVMIDYDDERVAYSCEGSDLFGYVDLGYSGEALTDSEWLDLTARCQWPAVPVQIVRYMQGDYSGDVVVVTNPPKGMPNASGFVARHKGVAASDCTVPVLLVGPDINLDPVPDSIWLQTLYSDVLGIDTVNTLRAEREPHSLSLSSAGVGCTLSPAPSLVLQLELGKGSSDFLCEIDVFRTFNTRIWIGAGIVADRASSLSPCGTFSTRSELFSGRMVFELRKLRFDHKVEQQTSVRYDVGNGITLRWTYPDQFSLGVTW